MSTIYKNVCEYNSGNLVVNNNVEHRNSQRIHILKITRDNSTKINNLKDNNYFNVKEEYISTPFTKKKFRRKKKIPPVPDFWGNIDDTPQPKINKENSYINNFNSLNKKNDRLLFKKFYSNDINKIITITKYNSFINMDNNYYSNFNESNINLNSKIDANSEKVETKNDNKTEVNSIINYKNNLNMNINNIINDSNEKQSSNNIDSKFKFKNDDVLNNFTDLIFTYHNNKNNDDVKGNQNSSKQIFKKSNGNLLINEVNQQINNINKFIGKKRKIVKV